MSGRTWDLYDWVQIGLCVIAIASYAIARWKQMEKTKQDITQKIHGDQE